MTYEHDKVLDYWNDPQVQSMYDKNLINQEIGLISEYIREGAKILDAGCGEAEGTLKYSKVKKTRITGADFSDARLQKASERLAGCDNVRLMKVDFVNDTFPEKDFDQVISQRFLINITEKELQYKVLENVVSHLGVGGNFLMLEGSNQGVHELNQFRALMGLPDIPIKWHNLFFDDSELERFMEKLNFRLTAKKGVGAYFLLTRGIRPHFESGELDWNDKFNQIASTKEMNNLLPINDRFSRLKFWSFQKE